MSTEETAKININIVISNQEGDGELPSDEEIEEYVLHDLQSNGMFASYDIDILSVEVVSRTGDLG